MCMGNDDHLLFDSRKFVTGGNIQRNCQYYTRPTSGRPIDTSQKDSLERKIRFVKLERVGVQSEAANISLRSALRIRRDAVIALCLRLMRGQFCSIPAVARAGWLDGCVAVERTDGLVKFLGNPKSTATLSYIIVNNWEKFMFSWLLEHLSCS
ncbi:hypothetical protein EVAR_33383_1 [Eumeta japonica]|uniref:Uncharacterized protein n=1 Tax=Eumeta variegata TaxID=151549 RepID=A0A4C1X220_EUMVA|nr:hypothetical protein EVAR_33383_1 [Eumeta japonica]